MTDKDYLNELNRFLYDLKRSGYQGDMYSKLAYYGVPNEIARKSIKCSRKYCAFYAETLINNNYTSVHKKRIVYQGNDENSFKHINVVFDPSKEKGVRDIIKLYIPVDVETIKDSIPLIYEYLFNNKINFQSKISAKVRGDIFCLRVNSKEDAEKIIKYCSSTPAISSNYSKTSPFVPHKDGIGIAKDTYGCSYNSYMADLLEEYVSKFRDSKTDVNDLSKEFQKFVFEKSKSASLPKEKYMINSVLEGIDAINTGNNILDYSKSSYNIKFDYKKFNSYRRFHDGVRYFYKDVDNRIIDYDSNPNLYFELQSYNCLHKMYSEYHKRTPDKDFVLNEAISNRISSDLDIILDNNENNTLTPITIRSEFVDDKVAELLPYLYASFAMQEKKCNIYQATETMWCVRDSILERKREKDNENYIYQNYSGCKISSNFPVISTPRGTLGIENKGNHSNVFIHTGSKIEAYKNVYIELDSNLISGTDEDSRIYRYQLANILSDDNRNKLVMKERNGVFGTLKYIRKKNLRAQL